MCSSPAISHVGRRAQADRQKDRVEVRAEGLSDIEVAAQFDSGLDSHAQPPNHLDLSQRGFHRLAQGDDAVSRKAAGQRRFSNTVTPWPRRASSPAQESPAGPEPTTATLLARWARRRSNTSVPPSYT